MCGDVKVSTAVRRFCHASMSHSCSDVSRERDRKADESGGSATASSLGAGEAEGRLSGGLDLAGEAALPPLK